jgi:hypothetical protein
MPWFSSLVLTDEVSNWIGLVSAGKLFGQILNKMGKSRGDEGDNCEH